MRIGRGGRGKMIVGMRIGRGGRGKMIVGATCSDF